MSSIIVCPECFEENVKGSERCARCGGDLSVARPRSRRSAEAPRTIGGLPINREGLEALAESRAPRKITILGVLAVVAVFIVVLQLSPTTKRAPTPIRNLRTFLVSSHTIDVRWTSSDTFENGLRYFALKVGQTSSGAVPPGVRLLSTDAGSVTGLRSHTRYKVTVVSVATNGTQSQPAVIYVTTK